MNSPARESDPGFQVVLIGDLIVLVVGTFLNGESEQVGNALFNLPHKVGNVAIDKNPELDFKRHGRGRVQANIVGSGGLNLGGCA